MKIKSSKPEVPEVDMTPMIDIVFQLIAFFMVITNFEQTQADERVKLPKNELAKPPEERRENLLTLNLGFNKKDGKKLHDDPYVFWNGTEKSLEQMVGPLTTESEVFQAVGTALEDVTVQIRADSDVPHGVVQELIQLCQRDGIGFQRFALAAQSGDQYQ